MNALSYIRIYSYTLVVVFSGCCLILSGWKLGDNTCRYPPRIHTFANAGYAGCSKAYCTHIHTGLIKFLNAGALGLSNQMYVHNS